MSRIETFTEPSAFFARGTAHAGFVVTDVQPLPELDGCAYVMRHERSGARLLWIACPDTNRSFSIAFKTPPADDTGVFHILEHSVLCGSTRYPVKEPFVNLLKTSMQTFLNALTFSDKTMYPVASTNERDLENLMDVYLDAVLSPRIYESRHIFEQEGWHYELGDDGALRYNGVVFNEMKGALSDPDEVMVDGLNRALFPESPYRFESGGEPRAIPTLSYEEFLDAHARHYQLSNSYVTLYGDLDADGLLARIDERLSEVAPAEAGAPNPLPLQAPVRAGLSSLEMATAPENACVGLGYVFATSGQRERVLAVDVLLDALMGSNEAPLKRAVLDADLGDDCTAFLMDGIAQPTIVFELKGARPGVADEFRTLVEGTCSRLSEQGIGHDVLASSLAQAEFNLREGDYGYPDGVALAAQALSSWLYDDDDPVSYLRYEDAVAHMRAGLDEGYFESLLGEVVSDGAHSAEVDLVPCEEGDAAEEAEELARKAASLGGDELAAIGEEVEALRAAQEAPDSPDDLARLPRLGIADIAEAAPEPVQHLVEAPLACWKHDIPTRRIDYVSHFFDLSCVGFAELPYVSVLAELLGRLDTKRHTAAELDSLVEEKLGSLSFYTMSFADEADHAKATARLVVGASALAENVDALATLPCEIWGETLFEDKERIRDILQQRRIAMEQSFMGAGHSCALARANSYLSAAGVMSEQLGGVDFYRFLKRLLDGFDRRFVGLAECLRSLVSRIFVQEGCEVSFTGADEDLDAFWKAAGTLSLPHATTHSRDLLAIPAPKPRREAFAIPANVCFVARAVDGIPAGISYDGAWNVASRALSLDYLWNEVRVKGGAYGCGFSVTANGLLRFYSYRDPAIDPTLARFDGAGRWLSSWKPTADEFEGYVVSTVAGHDAPAKPRLAALRQDVGRLAGREDGWRGAEREQELSCTPERLRDFAGRLGDAEANGTGGVCVFGSADIIAASEGEFDVIDLMGTGRDGR